MARASPIMRYGTRLVCRLPSPSATARDLQAENDRLRRQLDEATRAGKRQAAQAAEEQYRSLSGAGKEHFAMLCRLTHRP